MARWRRLAAGTSGAEIAEVAVVLPVVVTFLFAIMWFGRVINIYSTLTYAAREGANAALVGAAPSCATCGGAPTPTAATAAATARVTQVLQAAHIDATQLAPYAPTPAPNAGNCGGMTSTDPTTTKVQVFVNAQLNDPTSTGPAACGVVVSFQYPFSFSILKPYPPFGSQSFSLQLKAAVQMQGEN
jgi:hypothetical protein